MTYLRIFYSYNMHVVSSIVWTLVRFINPSNAEATCIQKHKDANIFENHLNPVMLVFIGVLLSTLRLVPRCARVLVIFKMFCIILCWPTSNLCCWWLRSPKQNSEKILKYHMTFVGQNFIGLSNMNNLVVDFDQ